MFSIFNIQILNFGLVLCMILVGHLYFGNFQTVKINNYYAFDKKMEWRPA